MTVNTLTDFEVFLAGLSIAVSQQGASTTIALAGEWDLAQRETMREAIQSVVARRIRSAEIRAVESTNPVGDRPGLIGTDFEPDTKAGLPHKTGWHLLLATSAAWLLLMEPRVPPPVGAGCVPVRGQAFNTWQ